MTGFARAEGGAEQLQIAWELRSVNGRGLDVRLRLPPGMERLDVPVRTRIRERLARGNVQASLQVARAETGADIALDEAQADALVAAARRLHEKYGLAMPDAGTLMNMRGVLSGRGSEETAPDETILTVLGDALTALLEARSSEGTALRQVLSDLLAEMEVLVERVAADSSRTPEAIRERLVEQVARLTETDLDADRLHSEAMILAVRADLAEEIERLRTHVQAGRALLGEGGAIGRRLDFLCQELNREANTLCSKSNAASVTAVGLDLKLAVDRFREQVQNVE